MPTTDKRVDAYIDRAQDFAKPILKHLRKLVHDACPDVAETLKWSMPSFEYKGILCGFAAFKHHCTFGFWKESLLKEVKFPAPLFQGDTINVTTEIMSKRESKSRPDAGIVEFDHRAYKQDGTLVAQCLRQAFMRKRPVG